MSRISWIGCAFLAATLAVSGCGQTDPGITSAVKTKFAADDMVKAHQINVDTNDHVVTLTGSVDSSLARERAVQLARNTDGVASVVDNLVVAPSAIPTTGTDNLDRTIDDAASRVGTAAKDAGGVMTDAAITSAVKTKFLADPDVSGLKIDVDTANGVVTLSGILSARTEKQRAINLARETSGVKSVVDQLKIAP
jgi:osmotically-inducible protein OsmY